MSGTVRIALVGEFGVGNVGNDASVTVVAALLDSLLPGADVTLVTRSPAGAERLGWPVVPLSAGGGGRGRIARALAKAGDLRVLIRAVARFDLVLVPGTGMLEAPRQRGPGGVITWLILLGVACRLRRVPLVWLGIGGSRYAHRLPARAAALAARFADVRSFRDPVTREALAGAGLRAGGDAVIPDVVFAGDASSPAVPDERERRRVVLSAIDWAGAGEGSAYTRELAETARRLRADGVEVVFVLADDADILPTRAVAALLSPEPETVGRDDFARLLAASADADVVVASRFHLLVAGLMTGRPVVALSHALKDDELLRWAGVPELCIPIGDVDAVALTATVLSLLETPDAARSAMSGPVRDAPAEIVAELSAALGSVGIHVEKEVVS